MIERLPLSANEIVETWKDKFHFRKATFSDTAKLETPGLRAPQIGALYSILSHLECGQKENGIIVMPTGTGKTETMLSFLIANQCNKTLVIVPSDALRTQIGNKYKTLGILKTIGVIDEDTILPKVAIIKGKKTFDDWKNIIVKNNVIVSTMASVTGIDTEIIRHLSNNVDFLIVDEAHHSKANTWTSFISEFPPQKVLLFTATPFRNDGKRLEGHIIFNYPLRKAQEDGYYKPIKYCPVVRYNQDDGDVAIAERAVEILKEDIRNGYDHILMARCKSRDRAEQVFKIYEKYDELNPILVHSGIANVKDIIADVCSLKHRIVVCVNMLGEGFDLPQLKIAAIHDERQSLPITLQFIGRFTRTSSKLGQASFVTNIAYAPIHEDLTQLYQQDADWNILLPRISDGKTETEQKANEFMREFKGSLTDEISISDIRPALSAEIYSCVDTTTNYGAWKSGIAKISKFQYQKWACTPDMLVIALGKTSTVDWGNVNNFENLIWDLIVVYFDVRTKRIYLNSTIELKGDKFLEPIFGTVTRIAGDKVFRIFANVRRLMLTNVGTRRPHGKDISFQSFFGSSVQDGLDELTMGKLAKNNIFGIGFTNGTKRSLGCSLKGKLWSRERDNLCIFKKWCDEMGSLVTDETIDTNTVLQHTLKYHIIKSYPTATAISFDWPEDTYEHAVLQIRYGKSTIPFDDFSVAIDVERSNEKFIYLNFICDDFKFIVRSSIIDNGVKYEIITPSDNQINFLRGSSGSTVDDFFNEYVPKIFFADGSVLYGNHLIEAPLNTPKFEVSELITKDWSEADLKKESQVSEEGDLVENSIQYVFSKMIWDDYKVIIDDDGSGEVADLIGINESESGIEMTLYHLKFALDGKVSANINNLYQVCGQAIKSIRWKYSQSRKLFDSLLKRNERKERSGRVLSSILKGSVDDVIKYREQALNSRELIFHIAIVQPGMSKDKCSEEMLILLGNVKQYLMDVSAIDLQVICSK